MRIAEEDTILLSACLESGEGSRQPGWRGFDEVDLVKEPKRSVVSRVEPVQIEIGGGTTVL